MIGTETSVDDSNSVHEELKNLPLKFENDENRCREILNSHIKRARSGCIAVDELIALISAFCTILYHPIKVSHSFGNLLSHLFAQLEVKWREGQLQHKLDVKVAQYLLLKRILSSPDQHHQDDRRVFGGNLVIWAGSMREIKFLTDQSRNMVIEWILCEITKEIKTSEDWPVLFHNLLQMCAGVKEVQYKIFQVLNSHCFEVENLHSRALLNHFLFLLRQNGSLCQNWLKFTLTTGKKSLLISPTIFVALLNLASDIECGDLVINGLKTILRTKIEIFERICRGQMVAGEERWLKSKSQLRSLEDPEVFLKRLANCFGSDTHLEDEITAALFLFKSFQFLSNYRDSFFLQIYKNYPFARREILKSLKSNFKTETWTAGFWSKIHDLDPIMLKEEIASVTRTYNNNTKITILPTATAPSNPLLLIIAANEPQLLKNLLENEDQIISSISSKDDDSDQNLLIQSLNELNSFLLPGLLKRNLTNFKGVRPLSFVSDCLISFLNSSFTRDHPWKNWSNLEIWLLHEIIRLTDLRSQNFYSDWVAKMFELCELIKIPNVIPGQQLKNSLIICAIEFVLKHEEERNKLKMISSIMKEYSYDKKNNSGGDNLSIIDLKLSDEGSKAILDFLLISPLTILSNQAILKFGLENVKTPNESFYQIVSTLLSNRCDDEKILILIARVCGALEHEFLRKEVVDLIGVLATKVVSEPVYSKVLLNLLDIRCKNLVDKYDPIPESFITKFSSVSEHLLVKAMSAFMLKFNVKNAMEEFIKSIIIFYGIVVEDDTDDSTETETSKIKNGISESMIKSKFTSLHLNERAIQAAFSNVLSYLHDSLADTKFIIKNYDLLIGGDLSKFDCFIDGRMLRLGECLLLLVRALTIGPNAIKLHEILGEFYQICAQFISTILLYNDGGSDDLKSFKKFINLVCLKLNKQIYLLLPLQQDKIQENLKTRMNLKKEPLPAQPAQSEKDAERSNKTKTKTIRTGKSVTNLIYEVEKFEEIYLKFISLHVKNKDSEGGWPDKIVRSTARDFKIRLDQIMD